jgi:hypothetical protein
MQPCYQSWLVNSNRNFQTAKNPRSFRNGPPKKESRRFYPLAGYYLIEITWIGYGRNSSGPLEAKVISPNATFSESEVRVAAKNFSRVSAYFFFSL